MPRAPAHRPADLYDSRADWHGRMGRTEAFVLHCIAGVPARPSCPPPTCISWAWTSPG